MDDRQRSDGGIETVAALAARHPALDALGRIDRLLGLGHVCGRGPAASPDVRQSAIVRDPINERPQGTLSAKTRQRAPERDGNLLGEVIPPAGVGFVAASEPPQRRPELREHVIEVAVLTHRGCGRSTGARQCAATGAR